MFKWGRQRVISFTVLYFIVMAIVALILYSRYEMQTQTYTDTYVHEFDQRIENYQSMQQKMIDSYYGLFLNSHQIAAIMNDAMNGNSEMQDVLRHELTGRTEEMFESIKNYDVRLVFFHLPNAVAFLRLHQPDKFGDSLLKARPSVVIAQREKEKIIAFETGKIFDGFRTVYPLFHHDTFVGTVEIAYPFLALKNQAMLQNPGAYTFLVKRSIQEEKSPASVIKKYYQDSPFGPDYIEDKESALKHGAKGFEENELEGLLLKNRAIIQKALAKETLQGVKLFYKGRYTILVLKPVKEVGGKHAAYMVELTSNHTFFADQLNQFIELLIAIAVLLALLMWYIYRYNRSMLILEQYNKAIDENMIVSKTDREGNITYVNQRFVDISGYSEEELIGKSHNFIRHPDSPSSVFEDLWNTLQQGKIWHGALQNRAKKGGAYYLNSTICPIVDESGDILEYIGLGEDITQLMESTKREEALRREAQRSEMAKMEFLANMSHEIRTPLNGIMGFAKLLSEGDLPAEKHRQALIITEQSKILMGIINDILDLSKIESGNLSLEKVVINPFIELENAFSLFVPNAQQKKIDYRVRLDSAISESIGVDILRLKQVMNNLISNALKFTPESGSIVVEVSRVVSPQGAQRLRFSVTDTGIGIAPEKLATIFSPFTQEDSSTTRRFGGTGLGLSISSKFVELFGGELKVESQKGAGSRFWFEIEAMECDYSSVLAMQLYEKSIGLMHSENHHYHSVKSQLDSFHISYIPCDESVLEAMVRIEKRCNIIIVFEKATVEMLLTKARERFNFIVLIGSAGPNDHYPDCVITIGDYDNCPSRLYNTLLSIDWEEVRSASLKNRKKQWQNRRVLVAEDYDVNRLLIEALLELHGIIPDFAENGKEACELIEQNRYDLVLMDINMPVMDGLEATCIVRTNHPDLPIVALTANALKGDKERFMAEGMSGYLSKPIDAEALLHILETFLGDDTLAAVQKSVPTEGSKAIYTGLKEALNLSDTVVMRLFDTFTLSISVRLKELEEAIERVDFENIKHQAHAIKGAAANLYLQEIADSAAEIEKYAQEGETADYRSLFEKLRSAFERLDRQHSLKSSSL